MQRAIPQFESIRDALVGEFYSRFSVDTGFDFHFESFVLSAQDALSQDETIVTSAFIANYQPAIRTANPEIIAKSAVIAACLGAEISSIEILADSSLVLRFNNNVTIQLPTSTPIVDWHWAITQHGGDPYVESLVACYAPGDIQGSMPNRSLKPNPLRGSA